MYSSYTPRRVLATSRPGLVLVCSVASLFWDAPGVLGQVVPDPPGGRGGELVAMARAIDAAVPTPAEAMSAFRTLEGWVRAGATPETAPAEVVACVGAGVVLRLDGRVIGRGSWLSLSPSGGGEALLRAARLAIAEAEGRLPGERDALWPERARELWGRVRISLELAGDVTPITLADWAEAARRVEPGVQGVAARAGERLEWAFPAAMLASQQEPGGALRALGARVARGEPLAQSSPQDLEKDHGVVFYRFGAVHLAQGSDDDAPRFLHRGARVVPTAELTVEELGEWKSRVSAHLARLVSPDGQMASGVDPLTPRPPATASALTRTLVCLALLRTASDAQDPAWNAGMALARALAKEAEGLTPAQSATAIAAWSTRRGVLTKTEGFDEAWTLAMSRVRTSVERLVGEGGGLQPGPGAMMAYALSKGEARERELAARALRGLLGSTPPERLVGGMPWVVLLERDLARERDPAARVDAAIPLRQMRESLWKVQLQPEALPAIKQDLAGAIALDRDRDALPSWQVARPVVAAAAMLREDRLTDPEEAARETARLLAALRFLRQLTVDESASWMLVDPPAAIGWVRASPWDHRLMPEAAAMTLLAIDESLRSLDELSRRPVSSPPTTPARGADGPR